MSDTEDQQVDAVFFALADRTRRLILDELRIRDGQSLFEVCVRLIDNHGISLSRQAISKHLNVLETADLIRVNRVGRTKIHTLHTQPIEQVSEGWLASYLRAKKEKK